MAIKKINIGGVNHELQTTTANITDLTTTATELNHMTGVTSNVQTQLNGKAASSHTHNYAGSSSAGGAATSANKLNTNAGDSNTPVYFSSGVPVACTSLDLNTTGSSASCTGNAATATKLQTARTIGLSTGVTGTATSFNGTGNVTIPVTSVNEAYLSWGGKNISGSVSPVDAATSNIHSANRFAFANLAGLTLEYSQDGGSTYTTYSISDAAKSNLLNGLSNWVSIGCRTGDNAKNTTKDDKLRITLNASSMGVYILLRKILIEVSTNGASGSNVVVERAMIGSESTYVTVGTYNISGWSGWNSIPIDYIFGGSSNQTSHVANLRLTFGITGTSSSYNSNLSILSIVGLGDTVWTYPSTMAKTGHLYTYDYSQNATFPANVKASSFIGSLTGNASTATTATTAEVSESDKGITTSGTGSAYTATVSGITALSAGVTFIMIPNTVSTVIAPTLNVNDLGAKTIRRRLSTKTGTTVAGSTTDWLTANKPVRVTYDGTHWVIDSNRPSASDIYGTIPISSGGTGAATASRARISLGAMADVAVTSDDVGKFLRVNSSGVWAAETVPSAESTSF